MNRSIIGMCWFRLVRFFFITFIFLLNHFAFAQGNLVPYTENLIEDSGFESGASNFTPNQSGTSVSLTQTNPIAGQQSLLINTTGYGDSILWAGRSYASTIHKRANALNVSLVLGNTQASASAIQICTMVEYIDNEFIRECTNVNGSAGDKGVITISQFLDASRDLARIRLGIFQEGSAPLVGVMIDTVNVLLTGMVEQTDPGTDPEPETGINLVEDPGFESGTSNFQPNQDGTSVGLVQAGALAGSQSLVIATQGYGDSILWAGREISTFSQRRSNRYTVRAHVAVTIASSSSLNLCAMVNYEDGEYVSECSSFSGSLGDKGVVNVVLDLDNTRDLALVRIGFFQEGSAPLGGVLIDDASAVLAGISGPGSGSSSSGSSNSSTSSSSSSIAGTPYPGFTYNLPTERPFISLDDFASTGQNSPAYLRLKAQVDDVVLVTDQISASATYTNLVQALNSGHYGYSATDSVVMYRLTGDVQYIQQAIRMVDLFVIAENAQINSGNQPMIAGDSYLEVGHYMEQLALVYDYGYSLLTETQRVAWEAYANQTIYNVWHPNQASWGGVSRPWTGWSINDPGNNYYYSFLKATQLWSLATQNMDLIGFLQQQKYTQLVPFFSQLIGGGSREGTGYGTAMGSLFENYRYWKSSTGEDLSALSQHARDTIDYWIYATVTTLDYYAAIGDQARSSMPRMFDFQRKLVQEAVVLNSGSDAAMRGSWWLNRIKVTDGGSGSLVGRMRFNYNFRYDLLANNEPELAPSHLVYDASGAGVLFARSDWSESASWLSFVAGIYDQSHAHQDQGSFSFYKNNWLAVTSNIFSSSGINQGVEVQNIIRFVANGENVRQNESVSSKTITDVDDVLHIDADLTPAYSNHATLISSWTRNLTYTRSTHEINIHDQCSVAAGVQPIWQLHVPMPPVVQADGSILAGDLKVTPVLPLNPVIHIVDMDTVSTQYNGGYRIELTGDSGCEFNINLSVQ